MSRVEAREAVLAGLPGLRRQFETWRARKGSGEAIPRNLWEAATSLDDGTVRKESRRRWV